MIVATKIPAVRRWRKGCLGTVGLVPTMGSLHEGHLSLVRRARAENNDVVVTIFVNPTQFGPHEDFARYPRNLEGDCRLLEACGCDLVFAPPVDALYPEGFETAVEPGATAEPLEGARRPGHFRGVATVVVKLLGIVEPTRAYFGEKDAQQLGVIRRVVADLDIPVDIVGCSIVRESDGLAVSSRNAYLDTDERRAATVLHRALVEARRQLLKGETQANALRDTMSRVLATEPLARVDYVSVADPVTFHELERVEGTALLSMAVFIGSTRLIDNLRVGASEAARGRG